MPTIPDIVAMILNTGRLTSDLSALLEQSICKDYYTSESERAALASLLEAIANGEIVV